MMYERNVTHLYGAAMQNITGLTYVPESNLWTVDAGCGNLTALENVTFTLGFNKFSLRPDQYVLQVSLHRRTCSSCSKALLYDSCCLVAAPWHIACMMTEMFGGGAHVSLLRMELLKPTAPHHIM